MTGFELREAVKHYGSEGETVRAVDGVSMLVDKGEFVALYGPSGSGKTTLLLLAAGITQPDRGSVYFAGRDLSRLAEEEAAHYRRRDIGFVFQNFQLMGGASALDNAAVKLIADGYSAVEARERALPWLQRVGLGNRTHHLPGRLSTGECQRVAIARALANDPGALLADEPTGNLDTRRSHEILELLLDLAHERSMPVLLATHDPQAAELADRSHTLRDGKLSGGLPEAAEAPAPT